MSAPHPAVRIGLVGYGTGGRLFHAPLIASAPGCELAGVVTTSAQRRAELAASLPGVPAYGSLADLAAAGVEAVSISTPAATHVPLAEEAIGLGLAVVCDKPFALDADAASATTRLAERAGTVLTVYQNRRWDAEFRTLSRLVAAGEIGAVRRFESRFERFRPGAPVRAAGGGTLRDLGSHLVDQALTLFGPADRVYGELHVQDDTGLDDEFFVAVQHDSGVLSHLWGSSIQGAPGPRYRVAGATGTFVVDHLDGQEDALRSGASPGTAGGEWGVEPPERWGRIVRGDSTTSVPSERGRWDSFYPAFAAAVRGIGPVPVGPWDAVAGLRVLDAALASAASRQVVTVPR